MAKKSDSAQHFEVSFDDFGNRRHALAHNEAQAQELAAAFIAEGLQDVQVHKVTTTRTPHALD